ncbi:sialate O-acetylesterase [Daejeonella sp.]|uniref:sialate O-acetylesterase n=1 Tax=Daejeonella sp. TaxID=2805397 RepID=UPI0030BA4009
MHIRIKNFLTVIISLSSITCLAQPDSNFHLYLLAGQSNMAGRGEISEKYKDQGNPRLYVLDKDNEWVAAKHPLHFDKPPVAGVGPGLSFGIEMANANPGVKIGLVPCAVGGTSINVWEPGASDKATKTHPYDDALKRIEEAMKSGVFKGVIWHQGESDSNPKAAAAYYAKLAKLIERVRIITRDPKLPFVAGELGRFKEQYATINTVLEKLPGMVKYTAVASSKGLEHKGDLTHFESASADKLGKRFASKMKGLHKKGAK